MKHFIVLSAIIFAASALPIDVGSQAANYSNSRDPYYGMAGWATTGPHGATRGGTGGDVWTVWDAFALRDAVRSDNPRVIYIRGRIDLTVLFTGSPGVFLHVGMYTSILGGDRNAEIFGGGLRLVNSRQLIVQDIKFSNAISYAPGERPNGQGGIINQQPGPWSGVDNIEITGSQHVWINHCEFSDDPWNSAATPNDRRRHNNLLSVVRGSDLVSISNNIFRNHQFVSGVGTTETNIYGDDGRLRITYYLNWFQRTGQRNPMVSWGRVHILNNLYTDCLDYAVGVHVWARIHLEANAFINCRRAWTMGVGHHPTGYLQDVNNRLVNSNHDIGIPTNTGWHPSQFYGYSTMNPNNVEAHVRRYAGVRL